VSRYAPISVSQLSARGFDYVALGHIHNRTEQEDELGRIRYCGFAQGRSFDEIGEGGVWIVDVDRDSCCAERKILSKRSFFVADIDISEADGFAAAESIIKRDAARYAFVPGSNLRIVLCGRAEESVVSYLLSNSEEIATQLGLEHLEIIDRTLPYIDGEYLERDTTLRGELYRILLPRLTSDDVNERHLAARALRIALAAIDGKSVFNASDKEGGRT
jgi:DNA repair exonuclease SbcCD nuclease subunit